jgi:hypothetical protein
MGLGESLVVGKETEFLRLALAVVEDDGALPASFLVVIEFAEVGDDVLSRPGVRADALDEREIDVGLPVLGAAIASEEHPLPPERQQSRAWAERQGGRFPLQRQNAVSTTEKPGNSLRTGSKIARFRQELRNLG